MNNELIPVLSRVNSERSVNEFPLSHLVSIIMIVQSWGVYAVLVHVMSMRYSGDR